MATVVAAVDQARVRSPWETQQADEAYAKQKTLEYGYKEQTITDRVAEAPPERHIVTKEVKTVHVPPEKHISAAEKKEVSLSTEVRLSLLCFLFQKLCPSEICFSITFSTFSLLCADKKNNRNGENNSY